MKRTAYRLLTAVLVAGSASVGFVPLAPAASAAELSLNPAVEGWYQPNPTCAQASGCLTTGSLPVPPPVEIPLSPYPAGTLHVGYASQAETARSYLAFSFDGLSGTLTGAKLDVPLDVDPANGDAQSATAKIQVCLATGEITPVSGSIAAPPTVACEKFASMSYSATPAPHLTADLQPLLLGLPTTSGLVLLPDASKTDEASAFRAVFSSHDRADEAKTPPATLTLTVTDKEVISTPEAPAVELPEAPPAIDSGFAPAPPLDSGFVPAPVAEVPVPAAPVLPQAPQQLLPTAQTVTVGYAYPVVWLLPLVLLLVVPLAARALTKDLGPVAVTA